MLNTVEIRKNIRGQYIMSGPLALAHVIRSLCDEVDRLEAAMTAMAAAMAAVQQAADRVADDALAMEERYYAQVQELADAKLWRAEALSLRAALAKSNPSALPLDV